MRPSGWTDQDEELTGLPGIRKDDLWQNTVVTASTSKVRSQEFLAGETLHGLAKRHDAFGVQTLRDLPDIEALEDAGLLSRRFTPAEALGNKEVADGE